MNENPLTKTEEFAKRIVTLAAEEGLSVSELRTATYIAQDIASSSQINSDAPEKFVDYPSRNCPLGGPFKIEAHKCK